MSYSQISPFGFGWEGISVSLAVRLVDSYTHTTLGMLVGKGI